MSMRRFSSPAEPAWTPDGRRFDVARVDVVREIAIFDETLAFDSGVFRTYVPVERQTIEMEIRGSDAVPIDPHEVLPVRMRLGESLLAADMRVRHVDASPRGVSLALAGEALMIHPFPEGDIEAAIVDAREAPARAARLRAIEDAIRDEADPYELDADGPAVAVLSLRDEDDEPDEYGDSYYEPDDGDGDDAEERALYERLRAKYEGWDGRDL